MATTIRRQRRDEDVGKAPGPDRYRSRVDDEDDPDDDEDESPRARRRRERDEEELPPRRSRARDEEDDDDDEPVSRRRGRRDDEDEDDEDEPRGRRRRDRDADDDDDDKDDEPRSRRSRRSRDDDDDDDDEPRARRRRVRDDDDDDELPPRNGGKGRSSAGWGAWKKKHQQLGNFGHELRVPNDIQILLKFMDDEPFCTYAIHWLTLPQGRRPFICLETGCPLCDDLGDSPKAMAAFNVLHIDDETGDAMLKVWAAGPGVTQDIETEAEAKTGPLTREYYSVSKKKSGKSEKGPTRYKVTCVKGRDLRDDWGIRPLSESTLAKFESKLFTEEKFLKKPTRSELKAVVRDLMDEDD